MPLSTTKYRTKRIDAVELTNENYRDVAFWVGGKAYGPQPISDPTDPESEVSITNAVIEFPTFEGPQRASSGVMVGKGVDGQFFIMEKDAFLDLYEPAGS